MISVLKALVEMCLNCSFVLNTDGVFEPFEKVKIRSLVDNLRTKV